MSQIVTKPTINEEYLESLITSINYSIVNGKTTICDIRTKNGFCIVGTSSALYKENFDETLGQKYAKENAMEKLAELEGYLIHEKNKSLDVSSLNFSIALTNLKAGKRMARQGWNGKGLYVVLQQAPKPEKDEVSILPTEPYFVIVQQERINTWVPSVSDILATDWCVIDELPLPVSKTDEMHRLNV